MVATPIVVARDYIVRNPNASNVEVAKETGASLRTVSSARKELREMGLVKPAYGDRGQSGPPVAPSVLPDSTRDVMDVQSHADLTAAVEAELNRKADEALASGEFNVAELKKILWKVMHRNTDDRIVVAAASALARIQAEADSRPLGPGKPMTRTEAKARLKMLLQACGISLVTEVLNEWIAESQPAPGTPT